MGMIIINQDPLYFTLELNGSTDKVPLDRLKPVHVDSLPQPQPATPPPAPSLTSTDTTPARTTCSG